MNKRYVFAGLGILLPFLVIGGLIRNIYYLHLVNLMIIYSLFSLGLNILTGYTGITPFEYASHFDTVYVSMWKYFNASSGAILAGPRALLDDLYHQRRMFGGALPGAWPLAAVALHFLDGFEERFAAGVAAGQELKPALNAIQGLRVEEILNGSNIFRLYVEARDPMRFREVLRQRGIEIPEMLPDLGYFALVVSETLARRPVGETVRAFEEAVGA